MGDISYDDLGFDLEELIEGISNDRKQVLLEDVFKLAIVLEKKSETLYYGLAEIVKDKKIKALVAKLAEEETDHYRSLKNRMSELTHVFENQTVSETTGALVVYTKGKLFDRDILREKLLKLRDIESIYEFAISLELEQIMFYQEAKAEVYQSEQVYIDELIDQERRHFLRLQQIRQTNDD